MLNCSLQVLQVSSNCMWDLSDVLSLGELDSCYFHENSKRKKKIQKHKNFSLNVILAGGTTPYAPFYDPLYLFSFKSNFYFESRFIIISLSSTILDNGVCTVISRVKICAATSMRSSGVLYTQKFYT